MLFTIAGCSSYQPFFQSIGGDNQPHQNSLCSAWIIGPYGKRHTKIWCNNQKDMFIPPNVLHFHGVRNCPIIAKYYHTTTYILLRGTMKSLHAKIQNPEGVYRTMTFFINIFGSFPWFSFTRSVQSIGMHGDLIR